MSDNTSKALAATRSHALAELNVTQEQYDTIFKTIASACKTEPERKLYLLFCREHQLNPIKGELHAVPRGGTVTFVVDYKVFVARARLAGWMIDSGVICKNDKFEGWNFAGKLAVSHISARGDRGPVEAAWAVATKGNDRLGVFLSFREMYVNTPKWNSSPETMATKVVVGRVARMAVPDLAMLYNDAELEDAAESATATIRATTASVRNVTEAPPARIVESAPAPEVVAQTSPDPNDEAATVAVGDLDSLVAAVESDEVRPPGQIVDDAKRVIASVESWIERDPVSREASAAFGILLNEKNNFDRIAKTSAHFSTIADGKIPEDGIRMKDKTNFNFELYSSWAAKAASLLSH